MVASKVAVDKGRRGGVALHSFGGDNAGMPTAVPPDDDDDFELELEALDPQILELERKRAQAKTDAAVASINPDELFPDDTRDGLGVDWEGLRRFRFTTRHLLILTAGLAMVMTLFLTVQACSGIFILGVVALAAGWWWVVRQERRQELERARRREEFFASRGASGEAATTGGLAGEAETADAANAGRRGGFSFSFSMQQMFAAMTAAAVLMGLMALLSPGKMALILGVVALVGVVVLTLVDVPPVVVLAWWILLVLYLVVGLFAALWGKHEGPTALRGDGDSPRVTTTALC